MKQQEALQLAGFVTSGMIDHPETQTIVNWGRTIIGPQNAAQARWWVNDCGLAVLPVYVGRLLSEAPSDDYEGAAAELRRQRALIAELVEALMAIYDRHNSATMAQARAALSKAKEQ